MEVKNNYKECLTNLSCSIQKYFEIEPKHNTIDYIDKLLEEKQPKNVVVILFDGMGSRILDRNLSKEDFFNKNRKNITTVFPATTTAATTSVRTGLNPVEHGWLGWNMYITPINETITLFLNTIKETGKVSDKFLNVKNKLVNTTITNQINEKGKYKSIELFPFGEEKYNDLDDMINIIKKECKKDGKKYIYAYDTEPDHTMHDYGPDSKEVIELIKERSNKVEKLCNELENSIIFVIADHGHKKVEHIFLKDYPELLQMLERTTSLEQRAVSFKVKEGLKEKFNDKFNELFGKDFILYEKQDIIDSNLFGEGDKNELFEDAIGDFIAIAYESNKCLVMEGDEVLTSQHAGYSDDEIYVPLIIIDRTK